MTSRGVEAPTRSRGPGLPLAAVECGVTTTACLLLHIGNSHANRVPITTLCDAAARKWEIPPCGLGVREKLA
jgi:hypothetical protein